MINDHIHRCQHKYCEVYPDSLPMVGEFFFGKKVNQSAAQTSQSFTVFSANSLVKAEVKVIKVGLLGSFSLVKIQLVTQM